MRTYRTISCFPELILIKYVPEYIVRKSKYPIVRPSEIEVDFTIEPLESALYLNTTVDSKCKRKGICSARNCMKHLFSIH